MNSEFPEFKKKTTFICLFLLIFSLNSNYIPFYFFLKKFVNIMTLLNEIYQTPNIIYFKKKKSILTFEITIF